MKLKGILDFSLRNFLCLRGLAPFGELSSNSKADKSYQRDPIPGHEEGVRLFLESGDYTFFPEVILGLSLEEYGLSEEQVQELVKPFTDGEGFSRRNFGELGISVYVNKTKGEDPRAPRLHMTATIDGLGSVNTAPKISRIDGNHRLEAVANSTQLVKAYKAPFCLVLFNNNQDRDRFSRAFFHNINFKARPLTMEQNLKLILDDTELFPDELLQENPSFGWPYYHARKLHGNLDMELLPNLVPFLSDEPRTFYLRQFDFLTARNVLGDNANTMTRFKQALVTVNSLFDASPALKESRNRGLLATLVYYIMKNGTPVSSFIQWVLKNHLHLIKNSNSGDLIAIFDKVLESRKRTIFVSMPFNKPKAEDHYATIERVSREVSESLNLNPVLTVKRVDWFHDGTSYEITNMIIEMMSDCGLLIGNLTYCNPNVYHEIGFVMGKAKAEGKEVAEMLLFLDESVEDNDKFVGFNVQGIKQLRFTQSEIEFVPQLKENLEHFFTP
jgi:hypothetical protein